ncbi:MAG: substrate-binding domain-containing protein [Thermodesulfobacteriota bacterium]
MQPCPLIKKVVPLAAGLFLAFSLFLGPAPLRAEVLEVPGTGACEVLLREVAEAFNRGHPGHQVMVPPSIGTVGGMRLITSDQAVLVRVARPLKKEEKDQGLTYLPFARDMVIFAVGAKVPVRSITTPQLVDVHTGKITTWQELGGPPAPIRVLLRQPDDSSLQVIRKHLEPFRQITFTPAGKVLYTDPDMLAMLQKYSLAIGWLTFSSLKGAKTPVHPLTLDGIPPTPENARSGQYKMLEEYALVFKEKRLNDLAKGFLDFLFSKNGQQVIKQYGAIPVEKE